MAPCRMLDSKADKTHICSSATTEKETHINTRTGRQTIANPSRHVHSLSYLPSLPKHIPPSPGAHGSFSPLIVCLHFLEQQDKI